MLQPIFCHSMREFFANSDTQRGIFSPLPHPTNEIEKNNVLILKPEVNVW